MLNQNLDITEIMINDISNNSDSSPIKTVTNLANGREHPDWNQEMITDNDIVWNNKGFNAVTTDTKLSHGYNNIVDNKREYYFTTNITLKNPIDVSKVTLFIHGIDKRVPKTITRVEVDTKRTLFYPLTGYDKYEELPPQY